MWRHFNKLLKYKQKKVVKQLREWFLEEIDSHAGKIINLDHKSDFCWSQSLPLISLCWATGDTGTFYLKIRKNKLSDEGKENCH